DKPLTGGIYFIVSPNKEILFELLLDKHQQFSIKADSGSSAEKVIFSGSPDNTQFQEYSATISKLGTEITALNKQLAAAATQTDSAAAITQIQSLSKQMHQIREDIMVKYPGSLLASLFHWMKEPTVPPVATVPGAAQDS